MRTRSVNRSTNSVVTSSLALVALAVALMFTPAAKASGECATNDLISRSGFEDLPDFSINFISDASTVFTGASQEYTFSVEYVDDRGAAVDDSLLEWCLEDNSLLTLSPDGLSATVASTGFELGSIDLRVRDPKTAIAATATVSFADLQPDGVYLQSGWVEDNGGGSGDIVLTRNAVTETIQPGNVLVSGDRAGVLVRVLTVNLTATQVMLTVEPATITDAFLNLDIDSRTQVQSIDTRFNAATQQVEVAMQRADGIMQRDIFDPGLVECKDEFEAPFPLQLGEATIDWHINIRLDGSLKISGGTVQEFSFFNENTFSLSAASGGLSLGASLSSKVTCELALPNYSTPTLPISVFSFGLGLQPKLGITAEGVITSPSFDFQGPSGQLSSKVKTGILYTDAGGFDKISEQSSNSSGSLFEASLETSTNFQLDSSAYGGIGFELVANLGKGLLSYELARVEFVELLADVTFESELKTPIDPLHMSYTGPKWGLAANVNGDFKAELTGGALTDLLKTLDVPVSISIGGPIFDPVEIPIAGSPQLEGLSMSCTPSSCYLDTAGGDDLTITLTTDRERSGQVDYLVSKDGSATLNELVSSELFLSSSLGEWAPTVTTPDGVYQLYLRLETDALSELLPYALSTTQEHRFEVGPTAILTVEKVGLADGTLIQRGLVTSAGGEVDCGDSCEFAFPSGLVTTLTAQDSGGWKFVKWADNSDVCAGSASPTCEATMTVERTAKAVFESMDAELRANMVGTWDLFQDNYQRAPYWWRNQSPEWFGCALLSTDIQFNGVLWDRLEQVTPAWRFELRDDGTGTYINIDQVDGNCAFTVDETGQEVITWTVSDGWLSIRHSGLYSVLNFGGPLEQVSTAYDSPGFWKPINGGHFMNRMYKLD